MKLYIKLFLCLIILITSLMIAACSDQTATGNGDGSGAESFILKLGHVGPADSDHPWEKYALEFAEKINEESEGRISIETYPSSQLGADRVMTESLQQNTLEMGLISTIAMGNFVPELQLWDLPYIFPQDNEVVDEILEGPIGDSLAENAAENGLVILAYWENDWRSLTNSVRPIQSVEDLAGLSIRVVENQPSLDWFERIGAIPTSMAFSELYTALQQGTIDGQDNGPILSYGSRLYEPQKYFTATNHIYAPLAFVVSEQTWTQLSVEDQEAMKNLAVELGKEQRQYSREVSQGYIQDMEDEGVEITELTDEQLQEFQESAEPTHDALAPTVGQDMIDQMLEYRDGRQ